MSEQDQRKAIVETRVVVEIPGMEGVEVRKDLPYREGAGGPLTFDLYLPAAGGGEAPPPVVVLAAGYPGGGMRRMLGRDFKEIGSTVSWCRLIAASGMAALAYTNEEPERDFRSILDSLRLEGAALGVDPERLGLWASSGNVPLALSSLLRGGEVLVRCAALLYGALLDLDGATGIADMAKQFGFANPCAGRSVDDLDPRVPLFLARAGQDPFPGLNEAMGRFLARAVERNLPVSFANHPEGPHAFDLFHDSPRTREIVLQVLAFLRLHLGA